jgi:hypothetical protein
MSTNYRLSQQITKEQLLEAVKDIGVTEHINENTTEESFCISDGEDYMWCYMADGLIYDFCRYGANYNAADFLYHAADVLDLVLYSEHDDDYWEDEDDEEDDGQMDHKFIFLGEFWCDEENSKS